jgi:predicted GNAT superfamily acetyltransferase
VIVIRNCEGFDELEACVQLQVETWGLDDLETTPRKTFLLAQKIGGQVMGAFDTEMAGTGERGGPESLVGFAMALPGMKTMDSAPRPYLHSHMLAVRKHYRNRGLGAKLKWEQRLEALGRGIRLMEWTFDPLEIKNAYLNIHKLGAVVRGYLVDFYGVSSSQLQGGLPTDRLVAEWWLDSPRVQAVLEGHPAVARSVKEKIEERISVPASIYEWKASEAGRERAQTVQLENRIKFQRAFSQGLAIVGFSLDAEGNGIFELGLPNPSELAATSEGIKK